MKSRILTLALTGVACLTAGVVVAQIGPPLGGGIGPAGCFPPPCIPIDGGLSMLVAAAIGIGGKKAYQYSKTKNA